ncbi:MAG: hypothetical protein EXR72_17365 [Myxococcales bacterium]|nr:hypothetical protein [Myxococcales bacterium]
MRICPACGSQYPDDANFCPMDASRLPPPADDASLDGATQAMPAVSAREMVAATMMDQPRPIAGRFMLGAEIGRTPTGAIYQSSDLTSGQPVALKVVEARTLPTVMMADRALRELKQLAKVKTDKIPRVVDQGRTEEGLIYIATEMMAGATLESVVTRQGALSFDKARAIVLQVGEALTEAQKVGVIHRDVAPRNVMVDGERVRVIDFGLAEPITDKVFGTPAFLSPEQAEGKPVDQRSNIYSLGALFYYMLTGTPPFSGDRDALVQQHLHVQPQPPSARRAGISPETDKLVLKALEKSGGRRHLTLRQLLNEIGTLVAPAGASARAARVADDLDNARTLNFGAGAAAAAPVPESYNITQRSGRSAEPSLVSQPTPAVAPPVVIHPAPISAPPATVTVAPAPRFAPAPVAPTPVQVAQPVQPVPVQRVAPVAIAPVPVAPAPIAYAAPVARAPQVVSVPSGPTLPMQVIQGPPAAAPAAAPGPGGKAARKQFRETAWFKKGELEEEMGKAAAEAIKEDPLAGPAPGKEAVVDENALTSDDRARLSLRATGRTEMMAAVKPSVVPGDKMTDDEMLAEVDSSRQWKIYAGVAFAVVAVIGALLYFLLGGTPS